MSKLILSHNHYIRCNPKFDAQMYKIFVHSWLTFAFSYNRPRARAFASAKRNLPQVM